MRSIEQQCNDTIERFSLFRYEVQKLAREVEHLQPQDISQRCDMLTSMHKELDAHKERLLILFEFSGPSILDTSCAGEFQRELFKSLNSCDLLYSELLSYRDKLLDAYSPPRCADLSQ